MRLLIPLLLLIALSAGATDVYRWVDAKGQTHYSDQWQPGAEKIQVTTTPTGARLIEQKTNAGDAGEAKPASTAGRPYEALEITRPAQEEVLWNIEGQLPVSVRVTPALQPGDSLRLYLDGKLQESETQLQEVYRGAHTLKAEVANQAGTVLIESPTVSFMVRQTSILNPPAAP